MAICPKCGAEHRRGTPCPAPAEEFDEYDLLEAYDEFMEEEYAEVVTEEEEAKKDGGSYKTFLWFFVAFGAFLLLAFLTLFLR